MKLDVATLHCLQRSGAKVDDERDYSNESSRRAPDVSPTLTPQSSCTALESVCSDVSSGKDVSRVFTMTSRKPRVSRKQVSQGKLPVWFQASEKKPATSNRREALRANGHEQLLAILSSQPSSSTRARLRAKGNAMLAGLNPATIEAVSKVESVKFRGQASAGGEMVGGHMASSAAQLHALPEPSSLDVSHALLCMGATQPVDISRGAFTGNAGIDPSFWHQIGQPKKIDLEGYAAELATMQSARLVIAPPPGLSNEILEIAENIL